MFYFLPHHCACLKLSIFASFEICLTALLAIEKDVLSLITIWKTGNWENELQNHHKEQQPWWQPMHLTIKWEVLLMHWMVFLILLCLLRCFGFLIVNLPCWWHFVAGGADAWLLIFSVLTNSLLVMKIFDVQCNLLAVLLQDMFVTWSFWLQVVKFRPGNYLSCSAMFECFSF